MGLSKRFSAFLFIGVYVLFTIALAIGLYFGVVVPVQENDNFKSTECRTSHAVTMKQMARKYCQCSDSSSSEKEKMCWSLYPCVKIFVNYTLEEKGTGKSRKVSNAQLFYSIYGIKTKCSYTPSCGELHSDSSGSAYVLSYYQHRASPGTTFSCYYNSQNESEVIDLQADYKSLIILLPFFIALLLSIIAVVIYLWRSGAGCRNAHHSYRGSLMIPLDEKTQV